MKDLYRVLGVAPDAEQPVIEGAFTALAKRYHPDVNPVGEERMKELTEAFDVLSVPARRRLYDLERRPVVDVAAAAPPTPSVSSIAGEPIRTRRVGRRPWSWSSLVIVWLVVAAALMVALSFGVGPIEAMAPAFTIATWITAGAAAVKAYRALRRWLR